MLARARVYRGHGRFFEKDGRRFRYVAVPLSVARFQDFPTTSGYLPPVPVRSHCPANVESDRDVSRQYSNFFERLSSGSFCVFAIQFNRFRQCLT
jgi:hypothetical protein